MGYNKTNIYVNNKLFRVCKAVILNISVKEISQLIDIKDIDEVIDKYYNVDNWNNIFAEFFREKYVVQAPFERLPNIRNDLAHNRFLEEDSEKKTFCK